MKHILLLISAALSLCSCVQFIDGETKVTSMGGRGTFKTKNMAGTWDHRQSWRDTTIGLAAVATSGFSYLGDKAAEGTAQLINNNATKQSINATNVAADVTKAEIGAGVTKATTLNPNVIPK